MTNVELAALDKCTQRLAFDILADDVMRAIDFADLVNSENAGMVERRNGFRLAFKSSDAIRILSEGCGKHFDRDFAFKPGVLGQENFSHSAPAKPAGDLIRPDPASDRR